MSKIVISEFMDTAAVDWLRERCDVHYEPALHGERDRLLRSLTDADALIVRNRTQVDTPLLAHAPRLKAVGRLGVGLENIELGPCRDRGITVIPATGANAAAVAEYVVCTAMMLLRRAYGSTADVMDGHWPRDTLAAGREIGGKTLGIIGLGSVGMCTARLAMALNLRIIGFDPGPVPSQGDGIHRLPDVDSVLREADIVSLHVPLAAETRHLINAERIRRMKQGAILINVARGGVVDEQALAAGLSSGHLGGAAIDVHEQEPLPAGSVLAGLSNLILTPHIAGVTRESNARVSEMIATRIAEHLHNAQHREIHK